MLGTDPTSLPLRDIHLPEPVSWWPPPLGWQIACLLIVMLAILTVYCMRRYRAHKLSAIYLARQDLMRIKNEFNLQQDKPKLIKELSVLIRHLSISIFPRQETAALTGHDWLTFLDHHTDKQAFNNGIGRVLIEAPYRAHPDFDGEALIDLISSWIAAVDKHRQRKQ